MTRSQIAQERLNEAVRVREAYDVQVSRHRASWRSAPPATADRAKRRLRLALEQQKAAKDNETLAWLDWQASND